MEQRDVEVGNQFASYRKGWLAGARGVTKETAFVTHENKLIAAAYDAGYDDGRVSINDALQAAALRYGYNVKLGILRGSGSAAEEIKGKMVWLKHGPRGKGGPGPCEPDCPKCALAAELKQYETT